MKKVVGFGLIILFILAVFWYLSFWRKTPEEVIGLEFKKLIEDYADATYLFSAILHVNPEKTSYSKWQDWIKKNQIEWAKIEKNSKNLLTKINQISIINSVYAQEEVELAIPKQTLEAELEKIFKENIKFTAEKAPKGEKIKKVMETFNLSAKEAQKILEELYQLDAKTYEEKAKFYEKTAKFLSHLKTTSFIAVATGGIILSAGEVLAASSLITKGVGFLTLSIEGADVVLAIGEEGAEILDNRKWKTAFVEAREFLGPVTDIMAFVDLKEGLKTAGNWITLYNYGKTAISYIKKTQELKKSIDYTLDLKFNLSSERKLEVTLAKDFTIYKNYFINPKEEILTNYLAVFPQGSYLIDNQEIEINISEKKKIKENKTDIFKNPEVFYRKYCEITIPISIKYGIETDVETCIRQQISSEEQLYNICIQQEKDKTKCKESIESYRKSFEKVLTRFGCEEFVKNFCSGIASSEPRAKENCLDFLNICKNLPEEQPF